MRRFEELEEEEQWTALALAAQILEDEEVAPGDCRRLASGAWYPEPDDTILFLPKPSPNRLRSWVDQRLTH